jgi:HEPN domain-containing protein/predicted nucleotidyltransferase
MIGEETIETAVGLLLDAAPPGTEVILFGSHATGRAREDSDLDFLVVEPTLAGRRSEMVRLRQVLRPLGIPVDVLVVSRRAFESWRGLPRHSKGGPSPMTADPAHVLLGKARDDEHLAQLVVGDATVSDEQIGFLAQQAVEKALKAVLSFHGVPYRRTHDLGELLDGLKSAGVAYPSVLEGSVMLTPFAAEMRYDYLPPEDKAEEPFDRLGAIQLVRAALTWAEGLIAPSGDVCGGAR